MSKRALLINVQNNSVEIRDCEAICNGLSRVGFQSERRSLSEMGKEGTSGHVSQIPIEDFDLIGFMPSFSALMASRKTSRTTFENIVERSRPGSLALFVCDTTLPLDPHMWNTTEGHKFKRNVYSIKPMKVIGSFAPTVLQDEKAMRRINSIWVNKLHADSEFLPIEWLSFHIDSVESTMRESLEEAKSKADEIYPDGVPEVKNFYYGIKKPKIAKRLKELGIQDNERNAVFGTIADILPGVRSFDTGDSKRRGPEYWAPIASKAEGLYIPYDPVKGDHQFTLRFLENYYLNPDGLIVDPLINKEIAAFVKPEVWESKADEASEKIFELF